jgi:Putative prokaryotic signal transducing protein
MPENAFVVRTFQNSIEAEFARAVLDANGITSMLLRDNAGGMLPFLDVMHPVRLVVRQMDVDTAVRLLDATAATDPKGGKPPLLS